MNRLAWAIGASLAAIGGIFLGQLQLASTELDTIGMLSVPAVVIGGMQSIPGAIIGGLLVIEQIAANYLAQIQRDRDLRTAVARPEDTPLGSVRAT